MTTPEAHKSTPWVKEHLMDRTPSVTELVQEKTGMSPALDEEKLSRVVAAMKQPDSHGEYQPYWFPHDTKRLDHAETLYRQGQVTLDRFGIFHVSSRSTKNLVYDIDRDCPCKAGQRQKTKWCAHLIATVIYRKMHAPLSGPWPREDELALFSPPPTIDERLARSAQAQYSVDTTPGRQETAPSGPQAARTPQDVSSALQEPDTRTNDSEAPQEVCMSESMIMTPVPTQDVTSETLQQQRSTIRHMLQILGYKPATVEDYQGVVLTLTNLILAPENFPAIIAGLQQLIAGKTKLASPVIPKEHLTTIQGVVTVKFVGLLHLARAQGLTSLVEEWVENLPDLALASATATFEDGRVFKAIGDATPESAARVKLHWRRMAGTRAKARALRDALGIEAPADDEME